MRIVYENVSNILVICCWAEYAAPHCVHCGHFISLFYQPWSNAFERDAHFKCPTKVPFNCCVLYKMRTQTINSYWHAWLHPKAQKALFFDIRVEIR